MSRFSFHLFLFPQTLLLHIQKILYHVEIIIKPVPYSLIVNYLWTFIMCNGGFWLVNGLAEGTRRRRCCSCRQKAITQLHWFLTSVLSVSPSSPPANGCIMNPRTRERGSEDHIVFLFSSVFLWVMNSSIHFTLSLKISPMGHISDSNSVSFSHVSFLFWPALTVWSSTQTQTSAGRGVDVDKKNK